MPGGIGLETGMRQGAAAAALVEQNNAVARRIVVAAHGGVAAAAGPAMHDCHRLANGVTALLEVDLVAAVDLEPLLTIGLDRWVEAEPLPCRHRLAHPVLVLCPVPSLATRNGYMRAGGLGKLLRGNVGAELARRATPEPQKPHFSIVEGLPARHPHVAHNVERGAPRRRRELAGRDPGAERQWQP